MLWLVVIVSCQRVRLDEQVGKAVYSHVIVALVIWVLSVSWMVTGKSIVVGVAGTGLPGAWFGDERDPRGGTALVRKSLGLVDLVCTSGKETLELTK